MAEYIEREATIIALCNSEPHTCEKATHPDVAEKLLAGMETVLTKILEQVKGARG